MELDKIITMVLQGVLVPLLLYGVAVLRNYLLQKIHLAEVEGILNQAMDAAFLAVQETAQTYVDGIKGTKGWDDEAQEKAFDSALLTAKMILSERGMAILEMATGSAEGYLRAAIETAVRNGKALEESPKA